MKLTLTAKIEKLTNEIKKASANKNNKSRLVGKILKLIELEAKLELELSVQMTENKGKRILINQSWYEEDAKGKLNRSDINHVCELTYNIPDSFKDELIESLVFKIHDSVKTEYNMFIHPPQKETSNQWVYTHKDNFSVASKEKTGEFEFTAFIGEKIYQFNFCGHYLIKHEIIGLAETIINKYIKANDAKAPVIKKPAIKTKSKSPKKDKISKEAIASRDLITKIKKESFKAKKSELYDSAVNQASEWARVYSENGNLMIAVITKFDDKEHGKNSTLTVYKTELNTGKSFDVAVPKKALLDQMYALFDSGIYGYLCQQTENQKGQKVFAMCYGAGEVAVNCQPSEELISLFHGKTFDGNKTSAINVIYA